MGQAIGALAAVDCALLVVNAQTGIELATERMFNLAGDRGLCRMIVINKIDADNVDLPALVANVRERFGKQCLLLDLPVHHGAGGGGAARSTAVRATLPPSPPRIGH